MHIEQELGHSFALIINGCDGPKARETLLYTLHLTQGNVVSALIALAFAFDLHLTKETVHRCIQQFEVDLLWMRVSTRRSETGVLGAVVMVKE